MRLGLVAGAAMLCALPAHGESPVPSDRALDALTQLDVLPTAATLTDAFAPNPALADLAALAINADRTVDLGVQLRAIHALPTFCPSGAVNRAACGDGTVIHDTLIKVIDDQQRSQHGPQDVLALRAAVEALGATRSGLGSDVVELLPLLGDGNRDVRATVARALHDICNIQAKAPLQARYSMEPVLQVRLEISNAIQDLGQCTD
jgi:hypothetical protein